MKKIMAFSVLIFSLAFNNALTPINIDADSGISKISISPSVAYVTVGGSQQFNAMAFDEFGIEIKNIQFNWSLNPSSNGSINQTGYFIGTREGVCVVTVQYMEDFISAVVYIIDVNRIEVYPPEVNIKPGAQQEFHAIAYDRNNNIIPGINFEWKVEPSNLGTISNGVFVASSNESITGAIVAKYSNSYGLSKVTIKDANNDLPGYTNINNIIISPKDSKIYINTSISFNYSAFYSGQRVKTDVQWSVYPNDIGIINNNGLFIPSKLGMCRIRVTASNGVYDECIVSIIDFDYIIIDPQVLDATMNSTYYLKTKIIDTEGNPVGIKAKWEVSNESMASIDDFGLLNVKNIKGNFHVFARVISPSGKFLESYTIVKVDDDLEAKRKHYKIEITPNSIEIYGKSVTNFTAKMYKDGELVSTEIKWSCEPSYLARINSCGQLLNNNVDGKLTVTASSENGISASVNIKINKISYANKFIMDPGPKISMNVGCDQYFKVIYCDEYENKVQIADVQWSVFPSNIGAISANGYFIPTRTGSCVVYGTKDKVQYFCLVEVVDIVKLVIYYPNITVKPDDFFYLTPIGITKDNQYINDLKFTKTSSNVNVANIGNDDIIYSKGKNNEFCDIIWTIGLFSIKTKLSIKE